MQGLFDLQMKKGTNISQCHNNNIKTAYRIYPV